MVDAVEHTAVLYPFAERLGLVEELHGHPVADPYRWLEDVDDPRTAAWSAAQDELFEAHRAAWPARENLRGRLAELLSVGMVSAPVWRGGRGFFLRRRGDQEHAVLLAVEPDGAERVLVDPMELDPSGTTTLDYWCPSPDGTRLAYTCSTGGDEDSELWVVDVASGALIEGPIDRVRFSAVAWLPDGESFYYTRYLGPGSVDGDDPRLHRRVYLHRVGSDPAEDVLIAGEGAPRGRYFYADVSADGRWLVVTAWQGTDPRNDVWIADLAASPAEEPDLRVLQEGVDAATAPEFRNGRLYLWTDRDAPRGRLCVVPTDDFSYSPGMT